MTKILYIRLQASGMCTALFAICRAYWGKLTFIDTSEVFECPNLNALFNFDGLVCFRYSPEELHAMVDVKADNRDDD